MSGPERLQPHHLTVLIALVEGSELLNEGNGAVAFKTFVSAATKEKESQTGFQDAFPAQGGRAWLLARKQLGSVCETLPWEAVRVSQNIKPNQRRRKPGNKQQAKRAKD